MRNSKRNSSAVGYQQQSLKNNGDIDLLEALAALQARRSFWAFRQYMHPKLLLGWWQRDAAQHLQQFYLDFISGRRPKLLIQAPPQHGKSMMIVDFIAWVSGLHPELRTIYASFSGRLGTRANLQIQRIMESNQFKSVFPDTGLPANTDRLKLRNTEIIEFHGGDGFFRNTTVRGSITGEGLDIGIIDDPIKGHEEARSLLIRDKTYDWLTDDFMTRFADHAAMLGIMTRWHVDDPFGRLIEADPSIKTLLYKAVATEDEEHRTEGEALFPEHKPLAFLEQRRGLMARGNWEALYQQSPTIAGGNQFKTEWFEIVSAAPAGCTWIRGWDLAASDEKDSAWTAGVLLGKSPEGMFYFQDARRIQGTAEKVRMLLVNTASQDVAMFGNVRGSIPQDPGQAGKAQVMDLISRLAAFNYRASPESGDKSSRAEPLEAQCEAGNVKIVAGDWNKEFLDELTSFPVGKYKDQVDAATRAFNELVMAPRPFEWNVGGKRIGG